MNVLQCRDRGLCTGAGDRQRSGDLTKANGLGFAFTVGKRGGKTTHEGVTGRGGVHRLYFGRHQVLKAVAIGKQRALCTQSDDHFTGARFDQLRRGDLGAVEGVDGHAS